jgi:hypothetical protein
MLNQVFRKITTLPYLPFFIIYILGLVSIFFINIGNIGQSKIESVQLTKITVDINKLILTTTLIIFSNFIISIILEKFNSKYIQLFFIVNLFILLILFFGIFAHVFKL